MPKSNAIKKDEVEDLWADGGERAKNEAGNLLNKNPRRRVQSQDGITKSPPKEGRFVDQNLEQNKTPNEFNFERAPSNLDSNDLKRQNKPTSLDKKKSLRKPETKKAQSGNIQNNGNQSSGGMQNNEKQEAEQREALSQLKKSLDPNISSPSQKRENGGSFIKDLVGTQLPKSYEFKNEEAGVREDREDREGEEGGEGANGRDKRFDPYEEANKLGRERDKEKEGKENVEEKIKIPEDIKLEVPGEVLWWVLGIEAWALLFAPLFFIVILIEYLILKVVKAFKFPKWKKILTWIMFFAACFEILIFVMVVIVIDNGGDLVIKHYQDEFYKNWIEGVPVVDEYVQGLKAVDNYADSYEPPAWLKDSWIGQQMSKVDKLAE